jgi:hypothetical protein
MRDCSLRRTLIPAGGGANVVRLPRQQTHHGAETQSLARQTRILRAQGRALMLSGAECKSPSSITGCCESAAARKFLRRCLRCARRRTSIPVSWTGRHLGRDPQASDQVDAHRPVGLRQAALTVVRAVGAVCPGSAGPLRLRPDHLQRVRAVEERRLASRLGAPLLLPLADALRLGHGRRIPHPLPALRWLGHHEPSGPDLSRCLQERSRG